MRILLTGGSGMVGRNILEHPFFRKQEILSPTHGELDLCDREKTFAYIEANKPDVVVHAAALAGGLADNMARVIDFLLQNLDIGRNVVEGSFKFGVKTLLNVGAGSVYPDVSDDLRERYSEGVFPESWCFTDQLDQGNVGYALAKGTVMKLCELISKKHPAFQYKTILLPNLYGRYDKFQGSHAHVIPAIINRIHNAKTKGNKEVEIWGSGEARRECMYVGDVADLIAHCLTHFDEMPVKMNVGWDNDYSINDFNQTAAKVIGYEGKFNHDVTKPEGRKNRRTDKTLQKHFGWQPKVDLEEGIMKTYEYFLTQNNGIYPPPRRHNVGRAFRVKLNSANMWVRHHTLLKNDAISASIPA